MSDIKELTHEEEVMNSVTHGVSACIILLLMPFSDIYAYINGGIIKAIGVSIFMISIFLMLLFSCLYHSMQWNTTQKYIFRILDHSMIYVAIAGSYTPVALCVIKGLPGIFILIVQWLMVILGILYKCLANKSQPKVSLTIYLIMGWTAILFVPSLIQNASFQFLLLIILGGVAYSIGAYFYAKKGMKYSHGIWHFFIMIAVMFHYIAIVFLM